MVSFTYSSKVQTRMKTSDKKRKTSGKKTNTYIEKRRKNNEAAKRSREKKRKRECLLEQKVKDLKSENEKLIA